MDRAVVDHEVVALRLEEVGGDVEHLLAKARAEYVTAPPAIGAERLPPVPESPKGVIAVSP